MHKLFLSVTLSAFLIAGCAGQKKNAADAVYCPAQRDLFVLIPDTEGKVGEIIISNKAGSIRLSEAYEAVQVGENCIPATTEILSAQDIQENFQAALKVIPDSTDHYILYFTSGTAELTEASEKKLAAMLEKIHERLPCRVSVVGHTDTRAGSEYNLALSLKRAVEVKKKLLAADVPREALEVSSHGENDPMIPTDDNVSEPRNRRVEIFVR
ncbi:MAG: OmpA family protein [Candidatus Electrothrix sp. YB6]